MRCSLCGKRAGKGCVMHRCEIMCRNCYMAYKKGCDDCRTAEESARESESIKLIRNLYDIVLCQEEYLKMCMRHLSNEDGFLKEKEVLDKARQYMGCERRDRFRAWRERVV